MKEELFTRSDVATEHRLIPLSDIVLDVQENAFRDDDDYKLDGPAITALAEELFLAGMQVPILVELIDGKYTVWDGHSRVFASQKLVQEGKWQADHLIPAQVAVGETTDQERLLRLGSANLARRPWGDGGMIRYSDALLKAKVPVDEIARVMQKSVKQVRRYLLVGGSVWAQQHVANHNVDVTKMSGLLQLADKNQRREDFQKQFDTWLAATKLAIAAENRKRDRSDQMLLTGDQLYPQKYLKAETIATWKTGITTGVWEGPSFKFKAILDADPATKKRTIEIDRLSADVDQLTLEETVKVFRRCRELADALEPVLLEKKLQQKLVPSSTTASPASSAAMVRLTELGLEGLVEVEAIEDGEDDDDFDTIETQEGDDLASTVQLPGLPSIKAPLDGGEG